MSTRLPALRLLHRRRSASFLELLSALISLALLLFGLFVVGSLYWSATVISTTSDVAAQSALSAYDRWRFGSEAFSGQNAAMLDDANHSVALREAGAAANIVMGSLASQGSSAGLVGVVPGGGSCGSPTAPYVGRELIVQRDVRDGDTRLNVAQVRASARWQVRFAVLSGGGLNYCLGSVATTSSVR